MGNADLYQDSSANNFDGDDNISAAGQSGQVGAGQEFDTDNIGVDDYIDTGADDPLDITGDLTISAWVYRETNGTVHHIASKNDAGSIAPWQFAITDTDQLRYFASETGVSYEFLDSGDTVSLNTWHHVTLVRSGGQVTFYIDGVQDSGWKAMTKTPTISNTTAKIGAHGDLSGNFFDGFMDEVRISNISRSTDWLAAEHANQLNPGTFFTLGSEQAEPAGGLTYAITGGTGFTAFAIDTNTGEITVTDSAQLDFETTPSFTLTTAAGSRTPRPSRSI
jgi:hypothetical protein